VKFIKIAKNIWKVFYLIKTKIRRKNEI